MEPVSPETAMKLAVDVGGTFTDVTVFRPGAAEVSVAKVPTTPDVMTGVLDGIRAADVDLANVGLFAHGTTVATNALITRSFPPAAMVTTKGFRDVIEIRRGNKDELWDAYKDVSPPYIRRRDRFEVTERIDYRGAVVTELDEDEARDLARILGRRGVETVAVCFINAYANPAHEQRMVEILEAELPDALVTSSAAVLPEIFEHERFSTTVANAVLGPLVGGYVRDLAAELKGLGYLGELLLLHSGGGVLTAATAERYGARLAASGLAAGAMAARHTAVNAGFPNAIGVDMGGTSTDISLIRDGEVRVTNEWEVEFGHPICFPSVELVTIGAGGGSLAWIDEGGSLRSGPQSAGSVPGPVAYGNGNEQPTTTDANLVLGRLGSTLLDGSVQLDLEAARRAIDSRIARPLGLAVEAAAEAIIEITNANMSDALRVVSVRRGYDPREFAVVAFGGAGPLHGAALAADLGSSTVIVPPSPGVTSALGCLLVDVRHDLSEMFLADLAGDIGADAEAAFARLEAEARERLEHEGIAPERQQVSRFLDLRYVGQWRSLSIPVGTALDLGAAAASFHTEHAREHNFSRPETPVEVYRVVVRAVGLVDKPEFPRHAAAGAAPTPATTRPVHFRGAADPLDTPVYRRPDLGAGVALEGPLVVEQLDSTTVVPPGTTLVVDPWLNLILDVS
ncbi:MAG TPA: hydantoinase/oxoprolinase family protein [Solirubrobacterales bacterium]|jgi:N-methylhydantoinase A